MNLRFFKYHGTGNDFILIDNRLTHWAPTVNEVAFLCDRHFGIGADGLMLLSLKTGFDFAMTYYNSDGHESTMCGNGGRCISAFAKSLGLTGNVARFWAIDGSHEAEIEGDAGCYTCRIKMRDTRIGKVFDDGIYLDTGSPHFVTFTDEAPKTDVVHSGRILRNDARFAPGGTNVDFVAFQGGNLFVRSYERGVEDETLSCGTGVTASALAVAYRDAGNPVFFTVKTRGGVLKVSFVQSGDSFSSIWLEGPAKFVYSGDIDIKRGSEVAR